MKDQTPERIMRLRSLEKWFVPELQPITLKVEDVTDESRYPLICEAARHTKDAE